MANVETYKAVMTRAQWRETYIRCQLVPPTHRESDVWMGNALTEIHDTAEVVVKASTGEIKADPFEKKRGEEPVGLDLSLPAIRGIKFSAIRTLMGYNTSQGAVPPANHLGKAMLLDSLKGVGPDGKVLRLVLKEAKLPETPEFEDDLEKALAGAESEKPKEAVEK